MNPSGDPRARVSRRSFIGQSTALAFYVSFAPGASASGVARKAGDVAADKVANIWVAFKPDGRIEVTTPVVEMGTGTSSTVALYVAEEMDADWKDLRVVVAPSNNQVYGNPHFFYYQTASGVRTALGYYDALRLAGAQARYMLLQAAAKRWAVPTERLTTAGSVVHDKTTGRQFRYADLVADVVVPDAFPDFVDPDFQPQVHDIFFGDPPPSPVQPDPKKPGALRLKRKSEFKLIGVDQPRLDIPSKTTGAARYGIDGLFPDMLYAMVLVSPQLGGVPDKVDATAARAVKGIVDIITLPYGVAVVGTTIFAVRDARERVKVSWRDAPIPVVGYAPPVDAVTGKASPRISPPYDSAATLDEFSAIARTVKDLTPVYVKGDSKRAVALLSGSPPEAVTIRTFETQSELAYHAPLEVQNAIVRVAADGKSAEVWVGTQYPLSDAGCVADVLGIAIGQVKVNAVQTGGAFGRRCEAGASIDAAHIASRAKGRAVKVVWTREDDIRRNPHRMALASRMEAAVDKQGKILATRQTVVADSWLARVQPDSIKSMGGSDINNWSAAVHIYGFPQIVSTVMQRRAVDVCFMRGIAVLHNKFCQESLIDSIAVDHGLDPLQYRIDNLREEPRAQAVLRDVAARADWSRKRDGRHLGVAYGDYPNTHVAMVTEISVDTATGEVKVHKIWCVIDIGFALMPDSIHAQAEGGIIMALSIALKERVIVKDNVPQQSNFHDYPIIRMSEVPDIDIKVISTDNPIAGAGEVSMYPVAATINCAIARATGKYLHRMPMLPDDVKGLVKA